MWIFGYFRDPVDESFYLDILDKKIKYFAKTKGMALKLKYKIQDNYFMEL